jgi:hypothetical protein
LSRFCGSTLPETFYTTTNLLRADFHSDIASFGRGFLFNWEATTDQPVTTTIASLVQSVPITTEAVSSNPVHGEVHSIQHYVMKFFSNL